jgi:hypothetical protein
MLACVCLRKHCKASANAGDDDVYGRRLPPWRRGHDTLTPPLVAVPWILSAAILTCDFAEVLRGITLVDALRQAMIGFF